MKLHRCSLPFVCVLGFGLAILAGCNNTLNPLCGSARPMPVIGSLSPNAIPFTQVQQGATLTVNGSNFVSSSEALINQTPLAANVVDPQQLTVKLNPDVISGPGKVNVAVQTPSGNSGELGCSSGGTSSALVLTVN
jgi:IPT/TIG domain